MLNAAAIYFANAFNSGIVMAFAAGAVLFAYGALFDVVNRATSRGVLLWIRRAAYIVFAAACGLCLFLFVYGSVDTVRYDEDAVIVLGAGLRGDTVTYTLAHRLNTAADYAARNQSAIIIVTGGMGNGETSTEASAMKSYLVRHGVAESRIVMEPRATSTWENMVYSKQILDELFTRPYKVAVITNGFHIYRSVAYAKKAGFDAYSRHAPIEWYTLAINYIRECAAVVKLWLLDRAW